MNIDKNEYPALREWIGDAGLDRFVSFCCADEARAEAEEWIDQLRQPTYREYGEAKAKAAAEAELLYNSIRRA